jgi:predicted DNA-binding transcriptional regulator AlpA
MNEESPVVWLTRPQLAERLQIAKSTIEGWAVTGYGPRFKKIGRHVRYRLDWVIAWENSDSSGVAS